jgi:class 3 adenylate cyclase
MSEKDDIFSESMDLEKLLEKKELLEAKIRDKFTKCVSVMFTDLKGSTALAEREGDMAVRAMLRDHNNIIFPQIENNEGVLVKSMGDGTLSYFENTQGALRAAVAIQKGFKDYNIKSGRKSPILIRVGIHTGNAIIEKHDIFGDVVNTASRFESSSNPSEIYISEDTYNALTDKNEIPCRFVKEISLKGKSEPFRAYKAYWDPAELEKDELEKLEQEKEQFDDAQTITTMPSQDAHVSDESRLLQQADILKNGNELIQLYLFCEEHDSAQLKSIRQSLISELQSSSPKNTLFFGERASWHYKATIITGRLREADHPITNQAISRAPVYISIRNGEGFIRVQPKGSESVSPIEIQKGGIKETATIGSEHSLGTNGMILFSNCFPMEYKVHNGRLLILKMFAMEDCVRTQMNLSLADVWKNYEFECGKLIIVGV